MRISAALAGLFLLVSGCTSTAPATPVAAIAAPEQAEVAATRAAIQAYVGKNEFSGTVLVAKEGKPVFRESVGLANRELNIPNTPETVFRLGSITKQFTAASILQLAEAGKLNIDDKVSKYYDKAPASWSAITIKHLLTHRSGIPSYTGLPNFFETQAANDKTPDEIVQLTANMPLEFEPGTKFAYDNTGYVLLGYVIEKVSGQSYAAYLQEHIFGPLGMKHSGFDTTVDILPNRAAGYSFDNGKWTNARYLAMTLPHAAGSLYSTVDDLLIWDEALFAGKVVSTASLADMLTDHGDKYGYGIGPGDLNGHKVARHSGGINGFATDMARFQDDGLTVIALANLESARSTRLATEIARIWLGVPAPPPPAAIVPVTVAPEVLDRYVGVYELMPKFNITVVRVDGGLTAQATGQGAFPLTATSDTEFHFQEAGIRIVFPAGDGPAQSLTLFQGGPREAKRIATN
ncbi:MAG: serine hydrolase [Hyphomonadaceae bacterium]